MASRLHSSNGHTSFDSCCVDSSKTKTGFAPIRLAWSLRSANPAVVYFGPSEMVKSTELPPSPKAAIVTLLVPWNKADEISIFLISPSESFVLNWIRLTVITNDSTPGVAF